MKPLEIPESVYDNLIETVHEFIPVLQDYLRLRKEGYDNFRYIPADGLTGPDGEGSVDGTHQTDLGFLRMSEEFLRHLRQ